MNLLPRLFFFSALAAIPLAAVAQPAPRIFVVDIARVFEGHPQTRQQQSAMKADEQKAADQLKKIEGELRAMADQLKAQQARFDDPTLSTTQRETVRAEGQRIAQEIQAKQAEGQQFMTKTQTELQQRAQKFRGQILSEIVKVATDVARRKGGTLVYDKGSLVYSDPAYDITAEVQAEVAKARPQK